MKQYTVIYYKNGKEICRDFERSYIERQYDKVFFKGLNTNLSEEESDYVFVVDSTVHIISTACILVHVSSIDTKYDVFY